MRPRHLLVLTATITPPPAAPGLLRTDPALRLADYRTALGHYCGLLGRGLDGIVFAENSGSDLGSLEALARTAAGPVEFLRVDPASNEPGGGRCFGESRILDAVMARSTLIAGAGTDDIVWKATGRYRVLNLPELIRTRPRAFDLYIDLRDRPSPWADMRLMAWTREGYARTLRGVGDFIREDRHQGRPGEENLHRVLRERLDGRAVTCLRREPLIDGVRAFDNQNWSQGRQKLVYRIRQAQRMLFGRVWF